MTYERNTDSIERTPLKRQTAVGRGHHGKSPQLKKERTSEVLLTKNWSLSLILMGNRKVNIRMNLRLNKRESLIKFLGSNTVFTWSHEDMLIIDSKVMVHGLNIDLEYKPVK